MTFTYDEFDFSGLATYPLKSRKSKARVENFATVPAEHATVAGFVDSLPDILAAADFKSIVRAIVDARRQQGGIVWGLGAHVVKTGLGPVLIDLMARGCVCA